MSDLEIGITGFLILFLLLAIRMPVGTAMLIVGAAGIWIIHPRGEAASIATLGGEIFSVSTVYSLTILPLFGLVRRLYDDRVAAATCFLFAIRPELIESSIEPIRGPTFWFFFVVSLYFIWRAR